MSKIQQYKSVVIYGFALFAMFFGSGNLIFPIKIGQLAGEHWILAFCGLFITGIALPFLGLFVVKLHKGNYISFFSEAGTFASVALPLFTLSLLGSFGVVPRCITVAHGGISYVLPQISLTIFSILFCGAMFFLCLKDQKMVHILGKWMSPILLATLTALIVVGIMFSDATEAISHTNSAEAFYTGFVIGYQTMDLFAAFFFSSLIFMQIQKMLPPGTTHKDAIKFAIKPSIIGATLLSLVYLGFVFLGSHFTSLLQDTQPEFMLPRVANHVMGEAAALFIAMAMLFSCLTTAVALNNIYARHLCSLFHLKNERFATVLLTTTATSFAVSLFDFRGIASFLAPALEISYPSIIVLTILSILTRKMHITKMILFYSVLMITISKWII